MRSTGRAARVALVVAVGAVGGLAVSSAADAQRAHPGVGRIATPPPAQLPPLATPYPGATVTIDPRSYGFQYPGQGINQRRHNQYGQNRHNQYGAPVVVYYYPYPYYPAQGAYPGYPAYTPYAPDYGVVTGPPPEVYDNPSASPDPAAPMSDPDLRGSSYVVGEGGAMSVDFGNGDRRTFPACAALTATRTPDGRPRTIFYNPAAHGVILGAGSRGRVLGTPGAGARACYTTDQFGRIALAY